MSGDKEIGRSRGDSEGTTANPIRQYSLHTFFGLSSQHKLSNLDADSRPVTAKDSKAEESTGAGCTSPNKATLFILKEQQRSYEEAGLTSGHKRAAEITSIEERCGKMPKLEVLEQNKKATVAEDIQDGNVLPKVDDAAEGEPISSSHCTQTAIDNSKFEVAKPPVHVSKLEVDADGTEEEANDAGVAWTTMKIGVGRRVPAPQQAPEDTLTEYEKERLENMRRNQLFLQTLGIYTAKESLERTAAKPKRAFKKSTPAPDVPLRRSLRHKGLAPENYKPPDRCSTAEDAVDELDDQAQKEMCFDDSSVEKYMCDAGTASCHYVEPSYIDWSELVGYRTLPGILLDPALTKIYTMDMTTFRDGRRGLLAAGGHKGQIAVFGTSSDSHPCSQSTEGATSFESVSTSAGNLESPKLLSWKAAGGWISQVQFLSQQPQDVTFLLSSSNDGSVVLWDLKKQQSGNKPHHNVPHATTKTKSLHSNGIFTMHELDGRIATGSKDLSLACSTMTEGKITKERVISGHHTGGIRGVRFREPNILADCGADGRICILDLRLPNACVSTINTSHRTPLNVVEWSPMQENLLLSASNDPQLYVFDIRSSEASLLSLVGHVKPQLKKCSKIYRPTFVGDGSMVITPGEGSKMLTLYSMSSGKVVRRGFMDFDPSLVIGSSRTGGTRSKVWAAGSHILQLAPMIGDKICKN